MLRLILIFFLFLSCATALVAQEICDNGIDDDLDGLVDLNDTTDCKCDLVRSNSVPSLIPNHSFEVKYSCPSSTGQMDRLVDWSQASLASSDFFDTCGLRAPANFKNPPSPLPDGSGYVGFLDGGGPRDASYKEYIGTCLSDTMYAGVSYRMEVSMAYLLGKMDTKLAIFGSGACTNLPFGGNERTFGCPTNGSGWVELDSVDVLLNSDSWTKVVFNFIPSTNSTAIVIGPSCQLTPSINYYFLDNIVLNTESSFYEAMIKDSGYLCANNLQLKAVVNFVPNSYQWYKNGVALVEDTLEVIHIEQGDTGLYSVIVSDSTVCLLSRPFKVEATQILADTDATKGCESLKKLGEINISNVRGGSSPYTFSLDNGLFSSLQSFELLPPKTYEIVIRDSLFCTDTIQVSVDTIFTPNMVLPPDSIFCDSINAVLLPNTNISDVNYLWNTQDTTTTIEVKKEGLYWLKVENECGFDTDSIDLSIGYFTPHSTIGNDSIFCDEMPNILIEVGTENNGESYVWSDGSDKNELSIREPGEYSITIENRCGSTIDTVNYSIVPSPMIHLGIDTALCGVFSYRLDAELDSMNYLWEPNGESSRFIYASQQGFYRVTVTDENGCEGVGEMEITDSCKSYLFMPNAFSPNADGLNDKFVPVFKNISEYDLAIYSRWGEKLFVSEDQSNHWDGTYKDKAVQSGYYIYTLSYKELESAKRINTSGVVYVLR